jgi:plastocyanin
MLALGRELRGTGGVLRVRGAIVVAGVVLMGLAAGCGDEGKDSGGEATTATTVEGYENPPMHARVEITSKGYRPKHTRILVGGTVTFVNMDPDEEHTAETKDLPEGASDNNEFDTHTLTWEEPYTITFHKPEKVTYFDSFDSTMTGTVEALAKADTSP